MVQVKVLRKDTHRLESGTDIDLDLNVARSEATAGIRTVVHQVRGRLPCSSYHCITSSASASGLGLTTTITSLVPGPEAWLPCLSLSACLGSTRICAPCMLPCTCPQVVHWIKPLFLRVRKLGKYSGVYTGFNMICQQPKPSSTLLSCTTLSISTEY